MFHHRRRGKNKMYYVYWRENGIPRAKAVGTSIDTVKEFELQLANRLHRRRAGLTINKVLFNQLCDEYITEFSRANKRASSIRRDEFSLNLFRKLFNNIKYVQDFDENAINAFKAKRRAAGIKDSTINRELNTFTSILKFAVQRHYLDQDRPSKVIRYKVNPCARERVLTNEEIKLIIKNIGMPYRIAVYFGLYAGLRSGEVCTLQYGDIDTKKKVIHIREKEGWQPKTKTSIRDVPLHRALTQLQAKLGGKDKDKYILSFPNGKRLNEGVLGHKIARLGKRLKLGKICYHMLRHTFVSRMAEAGADIYSISKILGHSSVRITEQVYTHLKDTYYQENINKLPDYGL